jgi:hypothetical protein
MPSKVEALGTIPNTTIKKISKKPNINK